MSKATLHLMVGLPGSGKTTRAKELEVQLGAVRFTPDEWHLQLFGQDSHQPEHDERHTRVERVMWSVAERLLKMGVSVILDYGFWSREERDGLRGQAKKLGVGFQIHYMDVPLDELQRRIEARNEQIADAPVFHITREEIELWHSWFEAPTEEELAR